MLPLKNLRVSLVFFLTLLSYTYVNAKEKEPTYDAELQALQALVKEIQMAEDTAKYRINEAFSSQLETLLEKPYSMNLDFSTLNNLSVLSGNKNQFRIFTWSIEIGDKNYEYYGYTQYRLKKKEQLYRVTKLENAMFGLQHSDLKKYKADQWKGALYYEIVPEKKKKSRKFLLLGWDGNDARSTKKVIEVLSFDRKGIPTFGAPVIKFDVGERVKVKYKTVCRVEFEYSAKIQMTLKYDKNLKMVVFDHLVPANEKLVGVRASYVPSFSYDGLYYRKGRWYMKRKIDARNKKLPKAKKYRPSDVK